LIVATKALPPLLRRLRHCYFRRGLDSRSLRDHFAFNAMMLREVLPPA
jgi:hypothetical protein